MTMNPYLLEAAKRIDDGEEKYSCNAISHLNRHYSDHLLPGKSFDDIRGEYAILMSPSGKGSLSPCDITKITKGDQAAREFRVLLLLMFGVAYKDLVSERSFFYERRQRNLHRTF